MSGPKIRRLYYTAKEVAEQSGLTVTQLRSLETYFPEIKPIRHRSGRRLYRPSDLKQILKIVDYQRQGYQLEQIAGLLHARFATPQGSDQDHHLLFLELIDGLEEIRDLLDTPMPRFLS